MSIDCSVPLNAVIAWIAWTLGVVCWVVDLIEPSAAVTVAAVICVGAGATLHVHTFIARLEVRERRAFEIGRESVRSIR